MIQRFRSSRKYLSIQDFRLVRRSGWHSYYSNQLSHIIEPWIESRAFRVLFCIDQYDGERSHGDNQHGCVDSIEAVIHRLARREALCTSKQELPDIGLRNSPSLRAEERNVFAALDSCLSNNTDRFREEGGDESNDKSDGKDERREKEQVQNVQYAKDR